MGSYTISYIEEDKPLGTAGVLSPLEGKIKTPYIVSNRDVIVDVDYAKILDFHKNAVILWPWWG